MKSLQQLVTPPQPQKLTLRRESGPFSVSTMQEAGKLGPQVQVQYCFPSTETIRTVRDVETRTAISTFTQLPSSVTVQIQCCFPSTETIRTIREGEPRTATSTFTQLLSSERPQTHSLKCIPLAGSGSPLFFGWLNLCNAELSPL